MLKGILIGLVVGAALTVGVLKAMGAGKPGGEGANSGEGAGSGKTEDVAALKDEAARLRAANEETRKTLDGRLAELIALEKTPEKDPAGKKGRKSWGDLAPKMLRMAKIWGDPGAADKESQKEAQAIMLDMFSMLGAIAKEYGLTLDDAMSTPDGLPAMMLAVLDASENPPSPAQRAEIEALMAKYGEGWKAFMEGRGAKSTLEQRLARGEMTAGYEDGLQAILTDAQRQTTGSMASMTMIGGAMGANQHYANGTKEVVTSNLTNHWVKTLKLEESHKAVVQPIVEEFIRDYEAASKAFQPGMDPKEFDFRSIQRDQLRAQIRAQQRLKDTLDLSGSQRKAVEDWATTYNFWINEGNVPTVPEPEPAPEER
ncbi:MAG: hypothetical protein HYY18_04935 [Planctomycetes bacterium]|nr:hypothetical protein [Planctomycetota bacterium]